MAATVRFSRAIRGGSVGILIRETKKAEGRLRLPHAGRPLDSRVPSAGFKRVGPLSCLEPVAMQPNRQWGNSCHVVLLRLSLGAE